MNQEQKKLLFNEYFETGGESTSTLEIFPGTRTLENEIQKYVQIRDFGLYRHFQVVEH